MQELIKLKDIVYNILKDDHRARNNDTWLVVETLRTMGYKIYIDYKEINNMPKFESITRCRRSIQKPNSNEGEFKADKDTQKLRQ